jgi:very-short-patch-repair endonuclease
MSKNEEKNEEIKFAKDLLENYKIEIIFNEEKPYTLYKLSDIAKIFKISHITDQIKNNEKNYLKINTKGGIQNVVFINYNTFIKFISKTRKPELINFCNKLSINLYNNIFPCIESETTNYIIKSFETEEILTQYKVDKYILDIYFPEYLLIVECDENHHNNNYIKKNDIKRENDLKLLIKSCFFIRYSPFEKNFNIFKLINEIYSYIVNYKIHNNINYVKDLQELRLKRDELKLKGKELDNLLKDKEIELEVKKMELEVVKNKQNDKINLLNDELNLLKLKINNLEYDKVKKEYKDNEINLLKLKIEELKCNKIEEINENEDNNSDVDDIDLTKVFFQTKKNSYGIKIPYVYQYNPTDLINPIKIHESPADVERDETLKSLEISPSPLRNAVKNNTIYKGFRWYYVKRNETPPESIPTTVENKHKEPEIKFIAMIDITKTKILAVYPNQKEATKARLMKANSFHRAIQNGSISSGHYWNYFDSCSEEMQQEYLKNNSLPEKYVTTASKKVEQICPLTKKVLKTYNSNREVIKNFKMSVSSLKKYSDSGEIHNGYIWKIV